MPPVNVKALRRIVLDMRLEARELESFTAINSPRHISRRLEAWAKRIAKVIHMNKICQGCNQPVEAGEGRYTDDDVFLCRACFQAVPTDMRRVGTDEVIGKPAWLSQLQRIEADDDDCREAQDNTPSRGPFAK